MPSTRDIRRRIKSVKSTAQITKAMQLVAAAKMKKAQDQAANGRSYSELMNKILVSLKDNAEEGAHPYFSEGAGNKTLVVVIGLMLGALAFVRKVGGGKLPMGLAVGKGRNLIVLESTSLGPQHSMHLVSVGGDRLIVVGSSPQGLSTLATIDDPTQAAMLLAASRGQNTSFNQMYDMETVMQGPGGDAFRGALTDLGRRGGWD
jgi:flagellar biogenesis protein FliO